MARPRKSTPRSWSARTGRFGNCKWSIPQEHRTDNFVEYPFAWSGLLVEAPPSSEELIYCNSDGGFALISQRDDHIHRMYFQCPTNEDVHGWTEEMIWDELQLRPDGPDGFGRKRGHIFDKMVLRFRSYVCEPLRYGNLFLPGNAGHTVPPTGAKGLNFAFADVRVLFEGIDSWASTGSRDRLDQYSHRALQRILRRRTSPTG
jgi:p-hydroxybenzoate 3-monooxygenase